MTLYDRHAGQPGSGFLLGVIVQKGIGDLLHRVVRAAELSSR